MNARRKSPPRGKNGSSDNFCARSLLASAENRSRTTGMLRSELVHGEPEPSTCTACFAVAACPDLTMTIANEDSCSVDSSCRMSDSSQTTLLRKSLQAKRVDDGEHERDVDDMDGSISTDEESSTPTLISANSSDSKGTSSTLTTSGTGEHECDTPTDHAQSTVRSLESVVGNADPYADVRERMTLLATRDKLLHTTCHWGGNIADRVIASSEPHEPHIKIPFYAAISTYLTYAVLIVVGHIRDFCASLFRNGRYLSPRKGKDDVLRMRDYAPLLKSWENFYTRRLYHRIQDCFNRPIASSPGAIIQVLERVSVDGYKTMTVLGDTDDDDVRMEYIDGEHVSYCLEFNPLGRTERCFSKPGVDQQSRSGGRIARECLNLGSYNYLGFADDWKATCGKPVISSLDNLPVSCSSSRGEMGTTVLHKRVEALVSSFLRKEDAIVYNMGFNTNATTIPALAGKRDLLISDELNHTSIVNGARASGARIRIFRHNDASHLEEVLRSAIVMGQPRTRRPWSKIIVVVEGVYSMEGEYCNLKSILAVCKKYKAYLYLDEAHSIGAMGLTGRGCCEYCGVDPAEVDLLMGTFTKSYGGMGGYVSASRGVVQYLREHCAGSLYHNSLSPVVCQQIISSFEVIMGIDGTDIGRRKLIALRDNSNYFRMRLMDMGLNVLGNYDSPIVPVLLYNPATMSAFSRECLLRGVAVVVVGFPAVPILQCRARFCISAGHTREHLDRALDVIDEVAGILKVRYAHSTFG